MAFAVPPISSSLAAPLVVADATPRASRPFPDPVVGTPALVRVASPAGPELLQPRAPGTAALQDDRLPQAIATAQRSAVTIETVGANGQPSKGAGVVVAPGYATVAAHMVGPGRPVYYAGVDDQGRRIVGGATFVGRSEEFDIAVVKLDDARIAPARYSAQAPRLGDSVIVIGAPYSFADTATVGVISGLHRDLGAQLCDCFQTDAAVNPGNSGGATFNLSGEVTGQIVGVYEGQGIAFVTTSDTLRRIVPRLMHGNLTVAPSELGFDLPTLAQSYASGNRFLDGAVVTSLAPGSGAARAGLRIGDRIVTVDDQTVVSIAQTRTMIALVEAGQRYRIRVMRGTQSLDFSLQR